MPQNQDDCPQEKIAHGNFGTIKDSEMLARFVPLGDKNLIDEHNRILRGALQTKNFLTERDGWSLLRQGCAGDMAEELEKYASQKGRRGKDYGYALVKAVHIRQILDKMQRRAICVIDDPQSENPAHALAQKARIYSDDEARKIRNRLLKKFTEVLTH